MESFLIRLAIQVLVLFAALIAREVYECFAPTAKEAHSEQHFAWAAAALTIVANAIVAANKECSGKPDCSYQIPVVEVTLYYLRIFLIVRPVVLVPYVTAVMWRAQIKLSSTGIRAHLRCSDWFLAFKACVVPVGEEFYRMATAADIINMPRKWKDNGKELDEYIKTNKDWLENPDDLEGVVIGWIRCFSRRHEFVYVPA
jgi:hypothetical protein